MNCVILGITSEIARNIASRLRNEGWSIHGIDRHASHARYGGGRWDLLIVAQGTMEPIGPFFSCNPEQWEQAVRINALSPLLWLRRVWPFRKPTAKVVFIGGPNLSKPTPTYTGYRAGKAILETLCATLEAENPGHKFRMLHPGVVLTRIHQQTIAAGERAANIERVRDIVEGKEKTVTHDEVFAKLKGLIA